MAASDYPPIPFTEREYLALEAVGEGKHEYFAGLIVGMGGAEPAHNLIAHNLHFEIETALRGRPCLVFGADQRVLVEATREYFYPDLVVTCADPIYADPKPRSLINPQIIVEILSASTEGNDRNAKWLAYRTIPTLTDYVLISSMHRQLDHYRRKPDETWRIEGSLGNGSCELSNGIVLDLDAIYRRVALT